MMIIRVSNYDHEDSRGNERIIEGTKGMAMNEAMERCKELCNSRLRNPADWYRVVRDDHKLYKWRP